MLTVDDGWVDAAPSLGYSVTSVARRLGVAPGTLRTWERRYGLTPSGRTAGGWRRYTLADVERLEQMRRLVLDGIAPAEAALAVMHGHAPPVPDTRPGGPGGRVIALPGADARARGLSRAAMALDGAAARALILEEIAGRGVIGAWERVVVPVLQAAGDRWAATGSGVEVEHLLSECAQFAFTQVVAGAPEARSARPAMLACAEDEGHCLPLYALAAALAERGVATRVLGAALPVEALVAAVRRTGPSAVFVWSSHADTASAAHVLDLPSSRPPSAVIVGGPGWDAATLPRRARLAYDLGEAVHLLEVAAGVG